MKKTEIGQEYALIEALQNCTDQEAQEFLKDIRDPENDIDYVYMNFALKHCKEYQWNEHSQRWE